MKKFIAMLLLVALVLVPVAALAAEIEFDTTTPVEEQKEEAEKPVLKVVDPALVAGAAAGQAVIPSAGVGR